MRPFFVSFDLNSLNNFSGCRIVRRYRDVKNMFLKEDPKLEIENPIVYEVFEIPTTEKEGDLIFLVTIVQPGTVQGEYFMTKGHFHIVENTSEVYYGLSGKGLILCQTKSGDFEVVPIEKDKAVYIPPFWAHRSVNTSNEPLVFFVVYPANAGHDYETVEKHGFKKRVFFKEDGFVLI